MKKLAIIFDGNISNPKGKVNSIINRIRELKAIADYQIDVYTIQEYDSFIMRLFMRERKIELFDKITLGGVVIKVIWHKRYFIDWFLLLKLHLKPFRSIGEVGKLSTHFKQYDLICSHSFYCGLIANAIHRRFGIPYVTNWHGSEIHTQPFRNLYQKELTTMVLREAEMNFFVSHSLAKIAKSFAEDIRYDVLYNGVNDKFFRYSELKREELRCKYEVNDCKVVAFVGNLIDIKNPLVLPNIFNKVKESYSGKVKFWIIGDGVLKNQLELRFKELFLDELTTFWGNQPSEMMPEFMNCIDVLILPSFNESFGMVLVEAMACGANVVGSKVGGIPEIIGEDYSFELDENFEKQVSNSIVNILEKTIPQPISQLFYWKVTAQKENNQIKRYL